jgi:hypothetical protein
MDSTFFPSDDAMKWVKDNVDDGEKVLILRVAPAIFYRDKYGVSRDKIVDFWYNLEEVSNQHRLRTFYRKNEISYIMFSYRTVEDINILKYLEGYRGNEFSEAAKFNLGENYIFIHKINR